MTSAPRWHAAAPPRSKLCVRWRGTVRMRRPRINNWHLNNMPTAGGPRVRGGSTQSLALAMILNDAVQQLLVMASVPICGPDRGPPTGRWELRDGVREVPLGRQGIKPRDIEPAVPHQFG